VTDLTHNVADAVSLNQAFTTISTSTAGGLGGALAVFSIQPAREMTLTHSYLTNVIGPAEDGHEQRVRLRAVPLHGLEYAWKDVATRESQLLASLLYGSEADWIVPVWPYTTRSMTAVTKGDRKVYIPTGWWYDSPFVLWPLEAAAGALWVVCWSDAYHCEAQPYTGRGSDSGGEYLTVAADLQAWPSGISVLPGFTGHLVGETPRDRRGPELRSGKLTFCSRSVL
jgi:hypothetical protein